MNKFEFMRNLEIYRSKKPSDVLQHDSYEIPEREDHSIKSDYFKAPKAYKDKITLYEEYNDSLKHAGTYKPAGTHEYVAKIENAFGPGKHRYFYTKEEWDNYNKNKGYSQNAGKDRANTQNKSTNKTYQQNKGYADNAGAERAKKDEWNAASKKTGLSYVKGTNKEYDNQYKKDRTALDEAYAGIGDLKKEQENMHKYG